MQYFWVVGGLAAIMFFGNGCSTVFDAHSRKKDLMDMYESGRFEEARPHVIAKAESHKDTGDELMWRLEAGTILFDNGDQYESSRTQLEAAEKLIRDYDQRASLNVRDAGAEAGAAAVNLNVLPYKGFYYDYNTWKIRFLALKTWGMGRSPIEFFFILKYDNKTDIKQRIAIATHS
ncbi:MAG: hypothetical protein EOM76_10490 [Sphingobacteriia bacterium]|nr:hypothetical protein [Sphingobacteriia bacterium]